MNSWNKMSRFVKFTVTLHFKSADFFKINETNDM